MHVQWDLSSTDTLGLIKCVLTREVSSFQGANNTYLYEVGTWSSVLIGEVSFNTEESFKRGSTVVTCTYAICPSINGLKTYGSTASRDTSNAVIRWGDNACVSGMLN